MKIKLNNVSKIFIILSLVIVVAGMALLGFLGLNQTVDYSDGYEMTVYAKNVLEDDAVAMKEATDEYLAQKGLSSNQFTTQVLNNGEKVVYKFTTDVSAHKQGVLDAAQAVLPSGITAEVSVNETKVYNDSQVVGIIIAAAVIAVVSFIYLFFMEKLAGSLTALANTVISILIYIALVACTRVPANPYLLPFAFVTAIASNLVSIVIVNRCNEKIKNNQEKLTNSEISSIAIKKNLFRLAVILGAVVLASVAVLILGSVYFKFMALHLVLATVSAVVFGSLFSSILWALMAKNKVKQKKVED